MEKEKNLDALKGLIKKSGQKQDNVKKVVLKEREGLIERVDKVLITKDGKQLLREQY